MPKAAFDVHYADGRTSLVMEADLQQGWTKLQKTYGFFRQMKIPYRSDLSIRAQLTVIAQPATFEVWAHTFPAVDLACGDDGLSYELRQKHLSVKVALRPHQPWRITEQGRPELFIERRPFLSVDQTHWYDLRGWIVFHGGLAAPYPTFESGLKTI